MKKIILTGFKSPVSEEAIRAWFVDFGVVSEVNVIADADAESVAIVEMDIDDQQAFHLVSRISNYWHDGALLSAHILNH